MLAILIVPSCRAISYCLPCCFCAIIGMICCTCHFNCAELPCLLHTTYHCLQKETVIAGVICCSCQYLSLIVPCYRICLNRGYPINAIDRLLKKKGSDRRWSAGRNFDRSHRARTISVILAARCPFLPQPLR